jgi:class III lanthionine synthetase
MDLEIERRQKRDVFWFVRQDSEFFESLSTSVSASPDYKEILDGCVPSDWRKVHKDVWLQAVPPDETLPLQGFKIHLSGTSPTATELLRRVVPICVSNRAGFKVMANPDLLELTTSKNSSRGASGKFITIYPRDGEHFSKLMEVLDKATNDMAGPYILSDKRYAGNKVLFYRYGGIAPRSSLNIFGESVAVIQSRDGSLVPDVRTPFFQLPEGIEDPFKSEDVAKQGDILLKDRYLVKALLVHSNSGGVYKAEDQHTGQTVIVKEARPLVNVTRRTGQDAVAMLRKEVRALEKLGHTGYVPKIVDLFQEWEHLFLVEEFVEGSDLSSYRARTDFALILQRNPTADTVKEFCTRLFRIAEQMIQALQAFHLEGVVMGDLSPHNVIIDPETLDLKVIDFEGARILNDSGPSGITLFTPGFVSPRRQTGAELSPQDDFYSLGSVIYSLMLPVQGLFQLNSEATDLFIDELTCDFGLPRSVKRLIFALLEGEVSRAQNIVESTECDRLEPTPVVKRGNLGYAQIREVIDGMAQYILAKADPERQDRLWPSDYRLFSTNPLNLAYGALGTALFLKASLGTLPESVQCWIDQQQLSVEKYPPGLFIGLSGIAWALEELGSTEKARAAFNLALQSPLLLENPDVFFGTAGVGLASLYLFQKTGEQRFLDKARELGDCLVVRSSSHENGCYWASTDGAAYFGYCHGSGGIALFLLYLHLATGDARYLSYAKAGMDYEIAHARIEEDRAVWGRAPGDYLEAPYWRLGTAGVGSVLIRFFAILGDNRYKDLAEKAGNAVTTKYAVLPSQFSGLSGLGEFLIDLYCFTGEQKYLNRAFRLAEGVLLFQIKRPEGIAFPGEELLRICTDFGTGSAGVGMFLLRLLRPKGRLFYEFGNWNKTFGRADATHTIADSVPELVCP